MDYNVCEWIFWMDYEIFGEFGICEWIRVVENFGFGVGDFGPVGDFHLRFSSYIPASEVTFSQAANFRLWKYSIFIGLWLLADGLALPKI